MGPFLPSGSLSVPVFRLATRVFIVTRRTYPKPQLPLPLIFLYHISICGGLFPPTELAERGPPVSGTTYTTHHTCPVSKTPGLWDRGISENLRMKWAGGLGFSFKMTMMTKIRPTGTLGNLGKSARNPTDSTDRSQIGHPWISRDQDTCMPGAHQHYKAREAPSYQTTTGS